MIRVFLDEGVRMKVHICREGEETISTLRREIAEENIPEFLGGKCRCPGGCVSGLDCNSKDGASPPSPHSSLPASRPPFALRVPPDQGRRRFPARPWDRRIQAFPTRILPKLCIGPVAPRPPQA